MHVCGTLMADVAIWRWCSRLRVLSRSVKYDAASWWSSSRDTTELLLLPSDFLFSFCLSRKMVKDSSPADQSVTDQFLTQLLGIKPLFKTRLIKMCLILMRHEKVHMENNPFSYCQRKA